MRLPLADFAGEPTVKIGKLRGTVARIFSRGIGFKLWKWSWPIVLLSTEIRLGNWVFKDIHPGMARMTDEELTITALNEEYLHEVICRAESWKASHQWDNFSFDLRAYINAV